MSDCSRCGAELMFSARKRGDGLCGPCSRGEVWTGDLRGLLDGACVTRGAEPWKSATPEEIMADVATISSARSDEGVLKDFDLPARGIDRSILRGLCHFADVAETEGQIDNPDSRSAIEWLKVNAGWRPDE